MTGLGGTFGTTSHCRVTYLQTIYDSASLYRNPSPGISGNYRIATRLQTVYHSTLTYTLNIPLFTKRGQGDYASTILTSSSANLFSSYTAASI
jgi:hypothetical protein